LGLTVCEADVKRPYRAGVRALIAAHGAAHGASRRRRATLKAYQPQYLSAVARAATGAAVYAARMTRFLFVLAATAACSHHAAPASSPPAATTSAAPAAPAALDTARAEAIVNAADRDDRDRKRDAQRKPVQLLVFTGVAPGMHAADIGAGTGYTSELVARAVGPTGSLIAQDSPNWDGDWIPRVWNPRLKSPAMANAKHVMRAWSDPIPPDARDLDLVTSIAVYHDVLAEKDDPAKMNAAVFAALKHGGTYVVIDNSAKPGTGSDACKPLHRIDEQLVRDQVQQAGFRFVEASDFMRNPDDTRDWNADPDAKDPRVHTQDLFALKFVKP
jgi:predicted methyltransferase